ncbi:protein GVQW3-like [Parasteatoda tepidariorum]|uniref:protein GVQW3-like n=1 Tax=Parasteatoda tepidariorum TaxID=114398 RepID=UPI0039BC75FC
MDKKEFHVLIKHCYLMGKNTVETKAWLDQCYPGSSPGKPTIIDWFAHFKCGRTNVEDAPRSGHPEDVVNPENIIKIHKIVIGHRKVKLHDIADALNISKERVGFILHEHLFMRKLFSKWVPRVLTVDQKQQQIDDSKSCLTLFRRNKKNFLHPPYSPDLAPSDFYLFADLKKMLTGKRFSTNEEGIAKTNAYFEAKDGSFF